MYLCIFLLEARFNQFSSQKVSFEVFFSNIIRAARFCRRCNSLQHPSEISPHATQIGIVQNLNEKAKSSLILFVYNFVSNWIL